MISKNTVHIGIPVAGEFPAEGDVGLDVDVVVPAVVVGAEVVVVSVEVVLLVVAVVVEVGAVGGTDSPGIPTLNNLETFSIP